MILNYKTARPGFRTDSSPQAGRARSLEASCRQAKALQQAGAKAAIFLAAISVLAIFSAPCRVSFSRTSTAPTVSLCPTIVSFGNQCVGTTSTAHTVTLKNAGTAALRITSLVIKGTNASNFTQTDNCGSSVAAGASCTIRITFKPSASGSRTAWVSITDNASGNLQTVNLTGTGSTLTASLSPTSLSFGSQAVGTPTAPQTITLKNAGSAVLGFTSLAIAGTNASDFSQTNTCGSSVAAGGSCTISVTFKPSATGSRTASVSVTDNASGSPQTASLSGTGGTPAANLSPTSLSFGSQYVSTSSAAQTITLSNTGSAALSVSSLAIGGTNAGDFAEIADTCGSSVAAGGNCTIGVTFTPSAAGQRAAALSITDNAGGSPQSVNLSGTGSPDVILSWTASPTPGVVGYNVYRGTTSGGEGTTPLNSTPVNGTTYADGNVTAGTTYYYVVTTVGSDGVQSAPSGETEATVPTS
jgi:hypothetical protein